MSSVQPLSQVDLERHLKTMPNWRITDNKLHAEFKLSDFVEAFSFMTKIALVAEKMDHHPEWSNIYNRVTIDLVTHDAGNAISMKDIELAEAIDGFAKSSATA